jgi:hypothetical protein
MRSAWRPTFILLLSTASCATSPRPTPTPPAATAQPAPVPAPAQKQPVDRGPLNPQMVADYVLAQAPMVKGCYDREREKKRDVSGKLLIRWTIDEVGGTRDIIVQLNTMQDPAVANCIQVLIRDWHFAKPPGAPVNVNFPFTFEAVENAKPPHEEPSGPKTSI